MSASSNTFGTFLQTFDSLEKQPSKTPAQSMSANLAALIQDLGKTGNATPLQEVVDSLPWSKEEVLSSIMEGKSQGLISITEEHNEPIVNLTGLGRFFIS